MSTISCTTVLRSIHEPIQSHTFLGIIIMPELIGARNGISSIMIGTLIAAIRQHMELNPFSPINEDIACMIRTSPTSSTTVATTRTPAFGDNLEDPTHGYRYLGPITLVQIEFHAPPSSIDVNREVLACQSDVNHQATALFLQAWRPMNLQLETHFIIIFNVPPRRRSRNASPFDVSSRQSPAARAALLHSRSVSRTESPVTVQPEVSPSSSSPSSPAPTTSFPSPSPGVHIPHSQNHVDISASLHPSTPIRAVCLAFGISTDGQTAASFLRGARGLFEMVRNHRAMVQLLSIIGLPDCSGNSSINYTGGLSLSAVAVLQDFSWTVDSFKHKSAWYSWSEDVAIQEWIGATPGEFLKQQSVPFH
jgi:hypothetical protein